MFRQGFEPVYARRTPEQAEEELAAVLHKLKIRNVVHSNTPPTVAAVCDTACTIESRLHAKKLRLNQVSDEILTDTLSEVRGIGIRSVNKIVSERLVNGDFLGCEDFDRRIKGLKYGRLEHLCGEANLKLSLSGSSTPTMRVGRPRHTSREMGKKGRCATTREEKSLVFATWNTGRMSRRSAFYEAKMGHLSRFVEDCGAEVLMLQEVCRGVGRDVSSRLGVEFGTAWMVHEDEMGDPSLVLVYRGDRAKVWGGFGTEVEEIRTVTEGFRRRPQVAFVQRIGCSAETLGVVHVHLNQTDPRWEIGCIADVISHVERKLCESSGEGSVVVGGDFNLSADSKAFDRIRRRDMVELVCPARGEDAIAPHAFEVLHTETTVGGQWLDNFWVKDWKRGDVREGWCFDFGGRRRKLRQSGYEFAAEKRSSCSDHLPVVMRIVVREGEES